MFWDRRLLQTSNTQVLVDYEKDFLKFNTMVPGRSFHLTIKSSRLAKTCTTLLKHLIPESIHIEYIFYCLRPSSTIQAVYGNSDKQPNKAEIAASSVKWIHISNGLVFYYCYMYSERKALFCMLSSQM